MNFESEHLKTINHDINNFCVILIDKRTNLTLKMYKFYPFIYIYEATIFIYLFIWIFSSFFLILYIFSDKFFKITIKYKKHVNIEGLVFYYIK